MEYLGLLVYLRYVPSRCGILLFMVILLSQHVWLARFSAKMNSRADAQQNNCVKSLSAIFDWVFLGIPIWCIAGIPLTCPYHDTLLTSLQPIAHVNIQSTLDWLLNSPSDFDWLFYKCHWKFLIHEKIIPIFTYLINPA